MPCVLKFLVPEALASAIIGKGGAVIKQIRESTQAKLGLTEHNELYPDTEFRVLTCQANTEESLMEVCMQIISKVHDCVQATPSDAVGEPGQLKLRTLMCKCAVGGIIGRGGSAIKQLRESSGCKITIAEPTGTGPGAEQVVSLCGTGQAIEYAMVEINKQVQALNDEPWWQAWASDTSGFGVFSPEGGDDRNGKGGRFKGGWEDDWGGKGGKGKGPDGREMCGDFKRGKCTRGESCRYSHAEGGGGYREPPRGSGWAGGPPGSEGLQTMLDVAKGLPPYVMDDQRGFALSCIVPNRLVGGLIGRGGSGTKEVQGITGTKIGIREINGDSENRALNIAGPLGSACAAYMLMMKRYLDAEREAEQR